MKTRTHALRNATNLVELVRQRAAERSNRRLYTFLEDGESIESHLTYAQLDERARTIGAALNQHGVRGERALLLYPPGLAYVEAFFGCLEAGVIAVPVYPPNPLALDKTLPRLQAIIADAKPAVIMTTTELLDMARMLLPDAASAIWLATDGLSLEPNEMGNERRIRPEDIAFLQYTSGSTADPKGVMVSHGNLIENSEQIYQCFGHCEQSQGVIWLPPYHDMGLIGGILQPLYGAFPVTLMSPLHFLQKPLRWLQAITRYQATTSGGPNFAYELCIRKTSAAERAKLELHSWELAFNGAEPIRPETLERFSATFGPCGFKRSYFYPCYGLAEATLIVSGGDRHAEPITETFDARHLLAHQVAHVEASSPDARKFVACGVALGQTVRIVDPETRRPTPPGRIGEIWVAGPSVAQGYWRNDEQTERVFRALTDSGEGPYLRTGDLGFVHNGELFIAGRCKDLIIVRGRNYYPQDIEQVVETSHPGLRPGCGAAFAIDRAGEEQLVVVHEVEPAYENKTEEVVAAIRRAVVQGFDIDPHAVVLVKSRKIPKTSSGKIQRHACRTGFVAGDLDVVSSWQAPVTAAAPQKPVTFASGDEASMQRRIATWIAAQLGQQPDDIDPRAAFSQLGLNSLQAVSLTGELEAWLGRRVSPTLAYEYPTIEQLAQHLVREGSTERVRPAATTVSTNEPIAIIGIGCRFPKARGPAAYWRLLREGVDAIRPVPEEREALWRAVGLSSESSPPWGGFIDEPGHFDPLFFKISQREAQAMDPQQRLLLEVTYDALEDAGESLDELRGTNVGVFVGISTNDYQRHWDAGNRYALTGNATSIAANRISYTFDFRGPSMALDTACSSSLVAIHLACQSLWSGDASLAIAGGVNLILSPNVSGALHQAGMLAPDGRCKAFDAAANGYVRGEGVGIVVLKPLSAALAAGDRIYAVIRGSATNNDGRTNGITAPNRQAQEAVLRSAYTRAGVDPTRVHYVEAHGTGTQLGDPIEAGALSSVIAQGRKGEAACRIGSAKTNIGHLEAAAGIAGLIKTALALHHRELPPTLHYKKPNPHIAFEDLGLRVQHEAEPWPASAEPRFAGVSSFGFGGTNAHVVLQSAPEHAPTHLSQAPASSVDASWHVLPLSAHDAGALLDLVRAYVDFLSETHASWDEVCRVAATRRSHHERRLAIVARSKDEAVATLRSVIDGVAPSYIIPPPRTGRRHALVFVLPDVSADDHAAWCQGANHLLATEPAFREVFVACEEIATRLLGTSIQTSLQAGNVLTPVDVFAIQIGLAALWKHWGVVPDRVVGRGVGEVAAAFLRGTVTLSEAMAALARGARSGFEATNEAVEGPAYALEISMPAVLTEVLDKGRGLVGQTMRDTPSILGCLAALYTLGFPVRWSQLHTHRGPWRALPTLPWRRTHHWTERKAPEPDK